MSLFETLGKGLVVGAYTLASFSMQSRGNDVQPPPIPSTLDTDEAMSATMHGVAGFLNPNLTVAERFAAVTEGAVGDRAQQIAHVAAVLAGAKEKLSLNMGYGGMHPQDGKIAKDTLDQLQESFKYNFDQHGDLEKAIDHQVWTCQGYGVQAIEETFLLAKNQLKKGNIDGKELAVRIGKAAEQYGVDGEQVGSTLASAIKGFEKTINKLSKNDLAFRNILEAEVLGFLWDIDSTAGQTIHKGKDGKPYTCMSNIEVQSYKKSLESRCVIAVAIYAKDFNGFIQRREPVALHDFCKKNSLNAPQVTSLFESFRARLPVGALEKETIFKLHRTFQEIRTELRKDKQYECLAEGILSDIIGELAAHQ